MEYVEFLTLLDIDDPSEFEFFESMATLRRQIGRASCRERV